MFAGSTPMRELSGLPELSLPEPVVDTLLDTKVASYLLSHHGSTSYLLGHHGSISYLLGHHGSNSYLLSHNGSSSYLLGNQESISYLLLATRAASVLY